DEPIPRHSRRWVLGAAAGVAAGVAGVGTLGLVRRATETPDRAAGDAASGATGTPTRRVPAEWEPHERTIMAWPFREDVWAPELEQAQADIAGIARTVAHFEPVLMVANPGNGKQAAFRCGPKVEVAELPINDCWTRDTGPIFVHEAGRRVGLD